jgi:Zinc finger, C2H2 type
MTAGNTEEFRCDLCGASLANEAELVEHREGHAEKVAEGAPEGWTGPALRCAICSKTFDRPEAVKAHHQSAHGL